MKNKKLTLAERTNRNVGDKRIRMIEETVDALTEDVNSISEDVNSIDVKQKSYRPFRVVEELPAEMEDGVIYALLEPEETEETDETEGADETEGTGGTEGAGE